MAVTLPYNITSDLGANASHLQANFQALADKFNQDINENDLSPTIVLPSANLSAQNVEEIVELVWNPRGIPSPFGIVIPAASTTLPLAWSRIGGSGAYTIASVSYAYTVLTGAGTNGSISVRLGNIVANVWSTTSTVVNTIALTTTTTTNQSASGDFSLVTTSFTAPLHIALMPEGVGTNIISLKVTIRLTRSLQ